MLHLASYIATLRYILRKNLTDDDEQQARVAINLIRYRRGLTPLTPERFDENADDVTAKIAEEGDSLRGRWRTLRWAMKGGRS